MNATRSNQPSMHQDEKRSLRIHVRRAAVIAIFAGAGILSFTHEAFAAISDSARKPALPTQSSLKSTLTALELPLPERLPQLRQQGTAGYRNLVLIMFDRTQAMEMRWRAVTAAGRIGGTESQPELRKALQSQDWFMRNAGLITLAHINRDETLKWARKLTSDRALVVRAAAVEVIAELNDLSSAPLLWQKLNAKENFKGGQSLFIRRRIVETLARMEGPGREGRFIEILADKDETLHAPAIAALERITNRKFGAANTPLKSKRAQWQSWWTQQDSMAF